MGVAGAIAGAAVVGAGATLVGSANSASAAKSAAAQQSAAATQASQATQAQYNQTRADLSPYQNVGVNALGTLESTLGLGGGGPNLLQQNGISGLTFQPTQAQLEATPGYQFDLSQGLQSVQNSNAASGRGISGAAMKGAASYATGLANNTLTTQQGIFQNNLQNVLGPLSNLSNLGENAAAQVGQQGLTAAQNSGNYQVGAANAGAAGTIGAANAQNAGLSAAGGAPLNYMMYNQLLGNSGQTAQATADQTASTPWAVNA
jgi:hypothetical protein